MNKNLFILILCGVIFCLLFLPDRCSKPQEPVTGTKTKEVIKEVQADTTRFIKSIDSLKRIGQKLSKKVSETTTDLKTAESLVVELLNDASVTIDSSGKEELHYQLSILKAANAAKDSLCNSVIAGQDSIIMNQAEQMIYKDSTIATFDLAFKQVVLNEKAKDKYIIQLKRQVRQKKFGNVVWKIAAGAAGLVILKNSL